MGPSTVDFSVGSGTYSDIMDVIEACRSLVSRGEFLLAESTQPCTVSAPSSMARNHTHVMYEI